MSKLEYCREDDIVTIRIGSAGRANTTNAAFQLALTGALERLEAEQDLAGVVLTSAKSHFLLGGDLDEMLAEKRDDKAALLAMLRAFKANLRRLERLRAPVVAALNGSALGSGLEVALACHRRIMCDSVGAVVGFPEVSLGLIPGAGGIVRTTRLLGVEKALRVLTEDRRYGAAEALSLGLIDEIASSGSELEARAHAWIRKVRETNMIFAQRWDRKGDGVPGGATDSQELAGQQPIWPVTAVLKHQGLQPAREEILSVAMEAARLEFDAALNVESRRWVKTFTSQVTKNMITAFHLHLRDVRRGKGRPGAPAKALIQKVGVIGAGMMGQGIACVSALAGIDVALIDTSLERAEAGRAYTRKVAEVAVGKGGLTVAQAEGAINRVRVADDYSVLAGCDLVIEAVFEKMPLKQKVVAEAWPNLGKGAVWGTNTSTLPVSELAQSSADPSRFVGIHFFSPVDRMELVEIVRGKETSEATLATAFDYVRQIGKTPIVVRDSLGFFTSRTFQTTLYEAAQLVVDGVHPRRVDSLARAAGLPVGPLSVSDEVSLKLMVDVRSTQTEMGWFRTDDDPTPAAWALVEGMVRNGRGGRQYGGGYYDYGAGGKEVWPALLETHYRADVSTSDEDVKDRILFRAVIETLKCLQEGVLDSVADANVGSLLGIGAPPHTGGYVQFVNAYGLQGFERRCAQLQDRYGERFRCPDIVPALIAKGAEFV